MFNSKNTHPVDEAAQLLAQQLHHPHVLARVVIPNQYTFTDNPIKELTLLLRECARFVAAAFHVGVYTRHSHERGVSGAQDGDGLGLGRQARQVQDRGEYGVFDDLRKPRPPHQVRLAPRPEPA